MKPTPLYELEIKIKFSTVNQLEKAFKDLIENAQNTLEIDLLNGKIADMSGFPAPFQVDYSAHKIDQPRESIASTYDPNKKEWMR